ncbi:MAG: response regulator [Alphaproteobacteria bacterium]|nr:response regulator [Alphaproteobacteria bacterium]MBV8408826.1 response regulator [Alphaproteobacteria bacterium]
MQQPTVLVVEDDAFQRQAALSYLATHDLHVTAVESGAQMRRQVSRAMPDLVLLDGQLPGREDGFALTRWLRESNTRVGIIVLTEAADALEKVLGLDSGADDCVAKPYEPRELLARCKSVLRRSVQKATPPLIERIRMGSCTLDLGRRRLLDDDGAEVGLTSGEFDVLKIFAENPNRPLSRDWLFESTGHRTRNPFDRSIDLRITRIRRKIEPMPDRPTTIRTVRGVGYMFVPQAD